LNYKSKLHFLLAAITSFKSIGISFGKKKRLRRCLLYLTLIMGSFLYAFPLIWMALTSLKPEYKVFAPDFFPNPIQWDNYPRSFTYTGLNFGKLYLNSTVITLANVVGTLLSSTVVAYGFARLNAPGKNIFLFY